MKAAPRIHLVAASLGLACGSTSSDWQAASATDASAASSTSLGPADGTGVASSETASESSTVPMDGTGSTSSDGTSGSDGGEVECAIDELPLTFTRSVYPTLVRSGCTVRACHADDDSVSGAVGDAHAYLLESGAVLPGASTESPLLDYLATFAAASPTTFGEDDRVRVAAWIDAGAELGELPVSACSTGTALSYAQYVAPIFAGSGCNDGVQCHAPGGVYPEVTYEGLVDAPGVVDQGWTIVVPGDVDASSLAWHLTNAALPAHIIDKPRIAIVDAWIRSGALP